MSQPPILVLRRIQLVDERIASGCRTAGSAWPIRLLGQNRLASGQYMDGEVAVVMHHYSKYDLLVYKKSFVDIPAAHSHIGFEDH
ncbi:hypothetical protein [Paenibacillus spongiae]|uniref:Uncharacterized protein n=1 Tax=Paenibacillus spongiae TaxID=2909671 RepID=A0ABY5S4S0_9BACL|nr:hypothetical protein [Paenibacillus spongiae]UVI28493.1 hypothetical protein L1F29_24005 [Paenibacillus spongiae]